MASQTIIDRKIDQISNQKIFQNVIITLKENEIDFAINDGNIVEFWSKKIASLTTPIVNFKKKEYLCCDISHHIFNVTLPDTKCEYSSDHIKMLYLDWFPKTVQNGDIICEILNRNKNIISEPDTTEYKLLRVLLKPN